MNSAAVAMHRRAAHLDFLRATRHKWTGGTVRTTPTAPRGIVINVRGVLPRDPNDPSDNGPAE